VVNVSDDAKISNVFHSQSRAADNDLQASKDNPLFLL
jgi:hypothetical protein